MRRRRRGDGFALLELVAAMAVLAAGVVGVATMFSAAATQTRVESDLSENAVLCQSKLEELRSLQFTDTATDTTQLNSSGQFPTTGGTGLAAGGSTSTATSGYADYMDGNGNHTTQAAAQYTRLWQIVNGGGAAAMKTITVHCADTTQTGSALNPNLTLALTVSQ